MRRNSAYQRKLKYQELWQRSFKKITLNLRVIRILKSFINPETEEFIERMQGRSYNLKISNSEPRVPFGIFLNESRGVEIWNLILAVLLIYIAVVTPFSISFLDQSVQDDFYGFDVFIDVFFILDLALNLNTAFYTDENILVTGRMEIFKNYLKHGLVLDFFASVPVTLINSPSGYSGLLKFVRLRSLARLLRLSKLFKAFSKHDSSILKQFQNFLGVSNSAQRVLKLIVQCVLCIHIVACIWNFLAKIDDYSPNTWVYSYKFVDYSRSNLYLVSVYWTMVTLSTIGYGDICPISASEKIFAMFVMALALFLFSFSVSSVTALLSQSDVKKNHLSEQMMFIDEFSRNVRLSKRLKKELQTFILLKIEEYSYSYEDRAALIDDFPNDLKKRIAMTMQDGLAVRFNLFLTEETHLVIEILPFLENLTVKSMQKMYSIGENPNKIFFLVKGRVNYLLKNEKISFQTFTDQLYFGDIETMIGMPRMNSAETSTECRILVMSTDLLKKIEQYYPHFYNKMKEEAFTRLKITQKAKVEMKTLLKMRKRADLNRESVNTIRDIIHRRTVLMDSKKKLIVNKTLQQGIAHRKLKHTSELLQDCFESISHINTLLQKLKPK